MLQVALLFGNKSAWWLNGFRRLGVYSFGVYLVHPLVLLFYRDFPPRTENSWLLLAWYAGGLVSAVTVSYIAVYGISRLGGWTWIFFGKLPRSLRKERHPFLRFRSSR